MYEYENQYGNYTLWTVIKVIDVKDIHTGLHDLHSTRLANTNTAGYLITRWKYTVPWELLLPQHSRIVIIGFSK
jgi:hypothetical protein